METPSRRNSKRLQFSFDEIESDDVSDKDASTAAGFPKDKLICLDATIDELATHEGERSVIDLLAVEVDGHKCNVFESGISTSTIELADQESECIESEGETSSENDASADLIVGHSIIREGSEVSMIAEVNRNVDPPFTQQASILQAMAQSPVTNFPELIFSMATGSDIVANNPASAA